MAEDGGRVSMLHDQMGDEAGEGGSKLRQVQMYDFGVERRDEGRLSWRPIAVRSHILAGSPPPQVPEETVERQSMVFIRPKQ